MPLVVCFVSILYCFSEHFYSLYLLEYIGLYVWNNLTISGLER